VVVSPNLPAGLPPALLLAGPAKPPPISIGAAFGRVVTLSEADQLLGLVKGLFPKRRPRAKG
jgi:hypothetical protein